MIDVQTNKKGVPKQLKSAKINASLGEKGCS